MRGRLGPYLVGVLHKSVEQHPNICMVTFLAFLHCHSTSLINLTSPIRRTCCSSRGNIVTNFSLSFKLQTCGTSFPYNAATAVTTRPTTDPVLLLAITVTLGYHTRPPGVTRGRKAIPCRDMFIPVH